MSESRIRRFFRELKRRKVIRVAVAYVVVSWILVEVASVMFPGLLLPEWSLRLFIALLVLGFPVALVLAWAFELTPDGARRDTGPEALPEPPSESGEPEAGISEDEPDGVHSVAVLPFVNLSNDPDNEYFSDGISEELLNLLCKLPQLTVASRTSSFSFKGKDADMATVASRLGVDMILEGSVRRSGDRVRITAQLIDGRADRHLWSDTYDRELTDVFAVQDEIATSIVDALRLSITPDQQRLIRRPAATADMDAYDFYLRGRQYVERGDVDSGQQMFERAIERDENYALAWAGAADCHSWRCMWYEKSEESAACADECSRKALKLAPDLAEAHASRSYALTAAGRYEEAEEAFRAAIRLDPRLYEAYYYGGRAYFAQGKFREAAGAFELAAQIRPDDPTAASLHETALNSLGEGGEELERVRRHAIEVHERYLSLNPDDALALSRAANSLAQAGDIDKAVEYGERALAISPGVCRYNVACMFMVAGRAERALDLLEEHARSGAVLRDWLDHDSDWDAVRDNPRFREIAVLAV